MGRGWGGLLFEGGNVGCGCELRIRRDGWVGVWVGVGCCLRVGVLGVAVSWGCGGWVVRVWVGVAVGWWL